MLFGSMCVRAELQPFYKPFPFCPTRAELWPLLCHIAAGPLLWKLRLKARKLLPSFKQCLLCFWTPISHLKSTSLRQSGVFRGAGLSIHWVSAPQRFT